MASSTASDGESGFRLYPAPDIQQGSDIVKLPEDSNESVMRNSDSCGSGDSCSPITDISNTSSLNELTGSALRGRRSNTTSFKGRYDTPRPGTGAGLDSIASSPCDSVSTCDDSHSPGIWRAVSTPGTNGGSDSEKESLEFDSRSVSGGKRAAGTVKWGGANGDNKGQ